jgi:MFS family permease
MYSSFILLPQFVQAPTYTDYGFGASVTAAGLFLLPATMAILIVGQLAGRLEHRYGSKPPLIWGAIFAALSFVLLSVAHSNPWEIYVSSGLLGIGIGLSFAAMANLIVQNVRQEQTGVATGMNAVTRTLGGAFGGQLAATLLAGQLGAGGIPNSTGFTLSFLMCLIALAVGVAFALWVPRRGAFPGPDVVPLPEAERAPAGPARRAAASERRRPRRCGAFVLQCG